MLNHQDTERFARHISLPEIGVAGQRRLLDARVLVIGAGGLGSSALFYAAAAGIGTVGIVDDDRVEVSNLQRQVIHDTNAVGMLKVASARQRLQNLYPRITIEEFPNRLVADNAAAIIAEFDLVIDGSDNFSTRYLTNDICVLQGKPNIFGSVEGFSGQVSVFGMPGGPCYRCLFPQAPADGTVPTCAEAGVLGVLPGVIGMLQVTEAIKIILGMGQPLTGRLLHYDALAMQFRTIAFRRDPECAVCGDRPTINAAVDIERVCAVAIKPTPNIKPHDPKERKVMEQITAAELKARIDQGEKLRILDVRNPDEHAAGAIPGAELVPLSELPQRLEELRSSQNEELIIHCQKGGRSARACGLLVAAGFLHPVNVEGGYDAWAALDH